MVLKHGPFESVLLAKYHVEMHPAVYARASHRGDGEPRQLDANDLIQGLTKFGEVAPAASAAFQALLTSRTFEKDEWLLRGGQSARWSFFIARGLVRELYVDAAGVEHIRTFLSEGCFTGSLVDLISGKPAITWIQALEPTQTLAFVYSDFMRLCDEHPSLQRTARGFVEDLYVRKVNREYELLALSARERYERWIREWRAVDCRVRRRDLASYLGVTPEHLSRLRANRGG